MEDTPRKPLMRKFEVWMLILGIGVIGYIFLKNQGFVFMEKTEQGGIVENPSEYIHKTKKISYDQDQNTTDLERILQELTTVTNSNVKIQKSDVEFYQKVKGNYSITSGQSISWMNQLSSSYGIYSQIRNLFSDNEQSQSDLMMSDIKTMISNPEMTAKLVDGIQSLYQISSKETKEFIDSKDDLDAASLVKFIEKKITNE